MMIFKAIQLINRPPYAKTIPNIFKTVSLQSRTYPYACFCNSKQPFTAKRSHHKHQHPQADLKVQSNKKGKQFKKQQSPRGKRSQKNDYSLTQMLRTFRSRMEEGGYRAQDYVYFSRKISTYYKKPRHKEFVAQKDQLERMLISLKDVKIQTLKLADYFPLLDILRVMGNIESIRTSVKNEARNKIYQNLEPHLSNLESLSLVQLATLYSKINPLYYPNVYKISSVFHDRLATQFNVHKKVSLSLMQILVLVKSMSKKEFLSFPDKKILEMILQSLKDVDRNDHLLLFQFAVAFKDLQIPANISDRNVYEISNKILDIAVQEIEKETKRESRDYLLTAKKTKNAYFKKIYTIIYNKHLQLAKSKQLTLQGFAELGLAINHLSGCYTFSTEDRQTLIQFVASFLETAEQTGRKFINLEFIEIINYGFFEGEIGLLDVLISNPKFQIYWSTILSYSVENVVFPLEKLEQRLQQVPSFKTQPNFLKLAISVSIQSKLQPDSEILRKIINKITSQISELRDVTHSLNELTKISIFNPELIRRFHDEFGLIFMRQITPSEQDIKKDRNITKNQKSQLFKFWEYVMVASRYDKQLLTDIISKFPTYAVLLVCLREINIKNLQTDPKVVLLLAINLQLQSEKLKFSDPNILLVIRLHITYIDVLNQHSQSLLQLFWGNIFYLISQYSWIKREQIPYANHLLSKLLSISNINIKNTHYFKTFLVGLLKNAGILIADNTHEYFKTSIIRQALWNNLITESQLPQLQWSFFTNQQKDLLKAMANQYTCEQITSQNLLAYLKTPSTKEVWSKELSKIKEIIDNSRVIQLQRYLLHFCYERSSKNDNILIYLCERLISIAGDQGNINIIGLLANIRNPLKSLDLSIYQKLIDSFIFKLIANPSGLTLIDHLQFLRILAQDRRQNAQYKQSLWNHVTKDRKRGSVCIEIMQELSRQTFQFTKQDYEMAQNYSIKNILGFLKVLLLNSEQAGKIYDLRAKIHQLSKYILKPIDQSAYTSYLQKQYELALPKSKTTQQLLKKANTLAFSLFELLQREGLKLRIQELEGEFIYHLGSKIVILFVQYQNTNQVKFIDKFAQLFCPGNEIFKVNWQANQKDISALLLQIGQTEPTALSTQSLSKIEQELNR